MKALRKGILLNTNGDKFNSMVISWGHFGIIWGKPTFAVYVRENRYTKAQLDKTREFTISIPMKKPDPLINKVCGMQSGRNIFNHLCVRGLRMEIQEFIRKIPITIFPKTKRAAKYVWQLLQYRTRVR